MKAEPSQLGLAKEMKASAIVALLAFSACTTVRVESLATLQGQTEAVTFSSHDRERKEGRKVSVTGLPEILARAAWVEGRPFHKGGDWVRFADGREIFLPVGFEFFSSGTLRVISKSERKTISGIARLCGEFKTRPTNPVTATHEPA